MNKNSIEIINSHIKPDEDLIAKTKELSQTGHNKRSRNHARSIGIAACLILFISVIVGTSFLFTSENDNSNIPANPIEQKNEILYSDLTDTSTQIDEDVVDFKSSSVMDVASFNESMLNKCIAIVEGEIVDMKLKEYTIVSEYDKFESDTLTEKIYTVVYEINIAKTRYGDIEENQTILIEDTVFLLDEVLSLKTGHSYVLPLYNAGNEIWETTGGKLISGDIKRESIYSTVYSFHPQIEVVDSGYIFSNDWETLATDEATKIVMDAELGEDAEYYKDKMMFASKAVFEKQFESIINNLKS